MTLTPEQRDARADLAEALRAYLDVVEPDPDDGAYVLSDFVVVATTQSIDAFHDVSTKVQVVCGQEMPLYSAIGLLEYGKTRLLAFAFDAP